MPAFRPDISVIIPTRNRPEILALCLDALAGQSLSRERFEVLVCDDGSTTNQHTAVRQMSDFLHCHYLRQEHKGPAAARNMGIAHAASELLLFLNDDAILASGALENHILAHQHNIGCDIAVLGAFNFPDDYRSAPFGRVLGNSGALFDFESLQPRTLSCYDYFYTCNISVPRALVQAVGGFDENFRGPAAEDVDLGYRLEQKGLRIFFEPKCRAVHEHRIAPLDFCRVNRTRGYWAGLFFLKHPDLVRRPSFLRAHVEDNQVRVENERREMAELAIALHEEFKAFSPGDSGVSERAAALLPDVTRLHQHYYLLGLLESPWLEELIQRDEEQAPCMSTAAAHYQEQGRDLSL